MLNKVVGTASLLFRPLESGVIVHDFLQLKHQIHSALVHLRAAMDWFCQAQDITGTGGVSAGYDLRGGWLSSYPETTGYIIPTFLSYAALVNDPGYIDRAVQMGDWEIEIQLPSGAVRGGVGINDYPVVFNTGQVMLGWLALYEKTGRQKFLSAAIKAADWLLEIQDDDGKWSQFTYNNIPHAYHSRVAWPLLKLAKISGSEKYRPAAEKNISWILSQVRENSWIESMGFTKEEIPYTHTIAYTLRGLLESSFYLGESIRKQAQDVVYNIAEKMMHLYERRKPNPYAMPFYLPGTINEKWKSEDSYSCLTGNAQIAIIWLKLYQLTNDARLLNSALKIVDQVKATQFLQYPNPGIRGGIAGSYPIYGKYMKLTYPNWAAKFFADVVMLQERILTQLKSR